MYQEKKAEVTNMALKNVFPNLLKLPYNLLSSTPRMSILSMHEFQSIAHTVSPQFSLIFLML